MKYLTPLLFISGTALAQTPVPTVQELTDSYVKALEQQLAFKNNQAIFFEAKLRDWIEYSKPLWAPPAPQAESK